VPELEDMPAPDTTHSASLEKFSGKKLHPSCVRDSSLQQGSTQCVSYLQNAAATSSFKEELRSAHTAYLCVPNDLHNTRRFYL